ncbi:PilC family type IV pilus tip adhesin [Neisseria iguanae]|uniref:Pilus assembly protein n=1 Tax=Neisseria iguanae TaxID=90242 RepID=A0A2P7U340_9NEIS|nr:PilC family type IV pilus tip adhesin [Neisseria iguanae]PSJ81367.1 pilus assembly protein [Neisseria iguanae]
MKSKSEKHIAGNRAARKNNVRPIILSVVSALSLVASVHASAAAQKFASVPFYLQNQSVTGEVKVKPNVMLFIDDSGSMKWVPGESRVPYLIGQKSRMEITKEALKEVVGQYKDLINWGFQTLNNAGGGNASAYTSDHADILKRINGMRPAGNTPTTRRYYELSSIVRNQPSYRCQKNYIVLMSDGDANNSWFYPRGTHRIFPADGSDTFRDGYFGVRRGGRKVDGINGITDSVFDREDGLGWFSQTLATKDFKTGGTDKTGKSWDGDPADPKDAKGVSIYKDQTAETFTVGFGSGISAEGKKYLERGASPKGGYFAADDADSLVAAFKSIFNNINASSTSVPIISHGTVAPAATSSNGVPDMAAAVELDSGSWSSRLKFFKLNPDGTVNNNVVTEPSFTNRKTMINNGKTVAWVQNLADRQMSNADFGISGGTPADQLEWKNVLLPWTARQSTDTLLNQTAKNRRYSQAYRIREDGKRDLGDILGSSLNTIGNNVKGRQEFMVTAANDGMVHMFQRASGAHPYDLKLSYIPAAMEREDDAGNASTMGKFLKDVAHEQYGSVVPHRYLVNGGMTLRRTPNGAKSKGQQMFMFGAMGQGGRGAYALNIGGVNRHNGSPLALNAGESKWLSDVPLFETEKGKNNKLGYTIGTPQIGRISVKRNGDRVSITENVRYAGFLSSGYRNMTDKDGKDLSETALYVYEMLGQEAGSGEVKGDSKGTLIKKIEVSNGVGGLSSPTLVDTDFDGIVDVAYAGDYGGNMYRFDLRGETPSAWKATRIFEGQSSQPVTSAPAVSRRSNGSYVVIFGTGSDIYESDLENKNQQAVYGIFDKLPDTPDANPVSEKVAKQADLRQQTMSVSAKGQVFLTNNPVGKEQKGWFFNLENNGERVVVKPTMILQTAILSTRSYNKVTNKTKSNGDVCIPDKTETKTSSASKIFGVSAENGGALNQRSARLKLPINDAGLYVNGISIQGITSFTYVDHTKLNDSPVTRDGDSGGTGTDQPLKPANSEIPNNKCFSRKAVRKLLLSNSTDSQLADIDIEGRICGIRRLSWREIFF